MMLLKTFLKQFRSILKMHLHTIVEDFVMIDLKDIKKLFKILLVPFVLITKILYSFTTVDFHIETCLFNFFFIFILYQKLNSNIFFNNRGKYKLAIEDYTKAIQLNPENVAAYNNRGFAYRKVNQYDKAINDYSKALEIQPDNVKTYNNRGYSYARRGDYDLAIKDYDKVIELDSDNIHAFHNRGISYDKKGKFKQAIDDFTRVLELDPCNANAYFNRGSAYDSIGQVDAAIEDYTKALDLDMATKSDSGSM
eukprot:gb/GECH01009374.1/.p1 GENE.gb/GECH01009374.1/~~gb/GECH01009374.1/.p1  ORF type:complete len:252 (+),score=24.63 gb/GECH01009374.1/:1-756(+)